jgi:hypothetical protein
MARRRQVVLDADATRAIGLHTEPTTRRRGLHAGGPDHGTTRNPLAADDDASLVHVIHRVTETDFDPEPGQPVVRGSREILRKRRKDSAVSIDDHDPRRPGIDAPELGGQRVPDERCDRSCHFDPGRSRSHHHERQQALGRGAIGLRFCDLEGLQDLVPQDDRVREALQARRERFVFVVPEVALVNAGREHEEIVRNASRAIRGFENDAAAPDVDACDVAKEHRRIPLPAQQGAKGRRDVRGRQERCRHLVQQRLKEVVIGPIDDGDPNGRALQRPCDG